MNETISVAQALNFVQSLLEQKGLSMNESDRRLFPYIFNWNPDVNAGEQFQTIANVINYSANTLQNDHSYKLRKLLKEVFDAPITNENLKEVVQREWNRRSPGVQGICVERQRLQNKCYNAIEQRGNILRIRAPRKMGKTMLLKKILDYVHNKQYLTVLLNFRLSEDIADFSEFLQWFCNSVIQKLQRQLEINNVDVSAYWQSAKGNNYAKIDSYFDKNIFSKINNKVLVLVLLNVDLVFPCDFAPSFLTLLRSWHETGQLDDDWGKLRLVLVHSTESYVKLDKEKSPFNVGDIPELIDFTKLEIDNLARQHDIQLSDQKVVEIMSQVGGHPYLIEQIITELGSEMKIQKKQFNFAQFISLENLVQIFKQHLERIWDDLEQSKSSNLMITTLRGLVEGNEPVSIEDKKLFFLLDSLGLVTKQDNRVDFRNNLYRYYFNQKFSQ
ncbi:AAA-like domain-containing protein [Planktothrix mougeotii]|uniref:AAA-like domain-containing protein n=1 Tax=Planktothrix mougeotii LEGE 06226 TaxID=1828728 RepID=A0ABR9UFB2_9CYAN|nr:AAA-like domain-containing protein [Planktothrix mougeotii]MBE9145150.1 AAA-like domain-containing protein [Planktothrix mougeotii LEGE 06226]